VSLASFCESEERRSCIIPQRIVDWTPVKSQSSFEMEASQKPFHSLLGGPFIFSNSRPMFYDFKVLWTLMYHYRNQQRSSFHFHRLNLVMKSAKKFRQLELAYIDTQDPNLLDELVNCARKIKESSLVAGAAIDKLISMKLYTPFALTAEAALASIFTKIDFVVKELELTKDPGTFASMTKEDAVKNVSKARVEKAMSAKSQKPKKTAKPEKLSKLSSMRKPFEKTDEMDDIFGDV
jgi:hypothetical protein